MVENSTCLYLVDHLEGEKSDNFCREECTIEKIKWKVITTLGFWCKEMNIEEEIQLVDFIGGL